MGTGHTDLNLLREGPQEQVGGLCKQLGFTSTFIASRRISSFSRTCFCRPTLALRRGTTSFVTKSTIPAAPSVSSRWRRQGAWIGGRILFIRFLLPTGLKYGLSGSGGGQKIGPTSHFATTNYTFQRRKTGRGRSLPGELKSEGEEFECALALDMQNGVKHWVRNLSNRPESSMWIQTKTDRFYPDFVAELENGKILVVEYKGEGWSDTPDTREKRRLGELWEEKSGNKALFLIVERDDQRRGPYDQIKAKIAAR